MNKEYPTLDIWATGQNIRKIMQKNHYTVRELKEYLGLSSPQSIYYWFSGRSIPSIDHLYALSHLFEVPVDSLLKGSKERAKDRKSIIDSQHFLHSKEHLNESVKFFL